MTTAPPPAVPRPAAELKPDGIIDAIMGYRKAKILLVAASLDVFTRLRRPLGAAALASALGADARAVEILLDALAALGYLLKRGGLYVNAPISARYLVEGEPEYLGQNLKYQDMIWEAWSGLGRAVKKGGGVRPLRSWLGSADFTREYILGMDNIAGRPAAEIAGLLDLRGVRDILDVGAGPGTYSAALLRRAPRARAVLLDLPGTLKITREALARCGEPARRIALKPADYRRARLGDAAYDLILLSHITHDEGPEVNRSLIARSFRALRPGGCVVIHDFMVSADRTAPLFGALFSVHMLAYTEAGRTYTAEEYRTWLEDAGLTIESRHPISRGSSNASEIIVARK